ncbi:MAG: dephospho-CoA kinase, partial [Clostridia bacterium]|nr:dephospho-CoA kinase [Clostridia bacterium]
MRIGLTGGIAAGKSMVSGLLAELGAWILDADAISREVVEPGTEGLKAIAAEFGEKVIMPDGTL